MKRIKKEKKGKKKEKDRDRDTHKSNHSRDRDRKSSQRKRSRDKKRSKRRRSSDSYDSERHTKKQKPKRYSTSSSSESDSYRRRRKYKKKDLDDPVVKRNDELRKTIRGCGVPLNGFTRDMTEDQIQKKLKKIIKDHEDEGMKETMSDREMKKVRSSILGKREIEDLLQIPKILQIAEPKTKGVREVRKVVKKRQSNELLTYDSSGPKTGDAYIDRFSDSESDKDPNYKPNNKNRKKKSR